MKNPFLWLDGVRGPKSPPCRGFEITLRHTTHTSPRKGIGLSLRPLPDNTQHSQQTTMPLAGVEPTVLASEWLQTHALDRAATGTGLLKVLYVCSKNWTNKFVQHKALVIYSRDAQRHVSENIFFFKDEEYSLKFVHFIKYGILALWPTDENQLYVTGQIWQGKVFSIILA